MYAFLISVTDNVLFSGRFSSFNRRKTNYFLKVIHIVIYKIVITILYESILFLQKPGNAN
jgi:hypothetical protein